MIDFATFAPSWLVLFGERPSIHETGAFWNLVLWFIYGLRTLRVLRVLRILRVLKAVENEVQEKVGGIVVTVLVMVLFSKFFFSIFLFGKIIVMDVMTRRCSSARIS